MKLLQAMIVTCALTQLISGKPYVQVDVLPGETATLPCEFPGIPLSVIWGKGYGTNSVVQWRINQLSNIDDGKYNISSHLSSEISQISLKVYDVNMTDIGDYFCAVTNSEGKMISRKYVALNVTVPATVNGTHGNAPTRPASTTTIPTSSTELQYTAPYDDNGYGNSHHYLRWIAVMILVCFALSAPVIIAVYRKRIGEAIKQRRRQRTPIGSTRSPTQSSRDNNDNEEAEEML